MPLHGGMSVEAGALAELNAKGLYIVEAVLDYRVFQGQHEYLVRYARQKVVPHMIDCH